MSPVRCPLSSRCQREETVLFRDGSVSSSRRQIHGRAAGSPDPVRLAKLTPNLASHHRRAIRRAPTVSHGLAALYPRRSVWRAEAATLTPSRLSRSSSSQATVGPAGSALRAHTWAKLHPCDMLLAACACSPGRGGIAPLGLAPCRHCRDAGTATLALRVKAGTPSASVAAERSRSLDTLFKCGSRSGKQSIQPHPATRRPPLHRHSSTHHHHTTLPTLR